ncbi:formyl transferase [Rhizobium helianthi]|uniref:phosphoribosylglycinamide formyltransferase 1 n=1 Tax=Rhizobium helianthi TaxID=1132695 RepID=A0ABW4LY93_9HYPH
MTKNTQRLLILTAGGINPQVMVNALKQRFPSLEIIEEDYESKLSVLKRRARKLGWAQAIGQLGTMVCSRLGKKVAAQRSAEIIRQFNLNPGRDHDIPTTRVTSLNDAQAVAAIQRYRPDVIFTISCRLLSRSTLAAITCPIVNFHAGINPAYRGQMGGYWSRVEGDEANFGGTLHLVDAGTDTGATLAEFRVKPAENDSIATYPLLITAAGTQIAIDTLEKLLANEIEPYCATGPSHLRFPPPLWTYLWLGFTRNIW